MLFLLDRRTDRAYIDTVVEGDLTKDFSDGYTVGKHLATKTILEILDVFCGAATFVREDTTTGFVTLYIPTETWMKYFKLKEELKKDLDAK